MINRLIIFDNEITVDTIENNIGELLQILLSLDNPNEYFMDGEVLFEFYKLHMNLLIMDKKFAQFTLWNYTDKRDKEKIKFVNNDNEIISIGDLVSLTIMCGKKSDDIIELDYENIKITYNKDNLYSVAIFINGSDKNSPSMWYR